MKKLIFKVKPSKMIKIINGIKKVGWYLRLITNGKMDYEDIIEGASSHTTMHEGEIRLALDLCLEQAARGLKKGQIVDLGPLGKIYPSVNGKWSEDPDELSIKDLTIKVNFRASDDVQDSVGTAKFSIVGSSDTTDDDEELDDPDDQTPVDTSTNTQDSSNPGDGGSTGDGAND